MLVGQTGCKNAQFHIKNAKTIANVSLTYLIPALNETGRACVRLSTCPKKFFFNMFLCFLGLVGDLAKTKNQVKIQKKEFFDWKKNIGGASKEI